ncbi:MAG: hypothetical protein QOH97_2999 [Actinoplanes sp.]|nr:hypothetical protein [Actinoplanes sp.]
MLDRNLDADQDATRSWSERVSGRTEAAADLADRVATLAASATGGDGGIRVTIASSGVLTGLELDDRVHHLPGAELAGEILRTIRRAQSCLAERVAVAVEETVGADTETGKAVLDSFARRFPAVPDDEPGRPVMPSPPQLTFGGRPTLPHQAPGVGFESGRDSRAR